ncbi:hypothetical protein SFRURICE_017411 [Spodoptera frugiperda]|nr:hypothetical protein SFRURICE_017411 [Spodoptera frugiperda]
MYEKRFFNYMRMSTNTFNLLLDTIKPKITGTGNNYRKCIPAEEKLVITISSILFYDFEKERKRACL